MMRYTFCVDTQISTSRELNCVSPNCVFNNYFCHGLLCNIVVLKVIKNEEK